MISVLFVDDEPNILAGLRRLLYPMRHEWEMNFAASGAEALKLLAQHKVDVIISDMKMPGMDGAQLLQQVGQQYPRVVRIILSGYAEKDLILRAISAAHQFMAKPCNTEQLKTTVSRAFALREILSSESLCQLVSRMTMVPSLPSLYQQLIAELQTPEPSIKNVSDIVQKDIGMTAKILQIINSAFFGLQRSISSTHEAVLFLGIETISSLTLGIGVFAQLHSNQQPLAIDQLWNHSLKVAELSQLIAGTAAPNVAAHAFTAGLLHDIGQVILATNFPQEYEDMLRNLGRAQTSLSEAESLIFGAPNASVGAYLLGLWGVPYPVVEAVAYHHDPEQYPSTSFTALTAVHVANSLVENAEADILAAPEKYLDKAYLQRLQLWEQVPVWYAACLKKEAQAA